MVNLFSQIILIWNNQTTLISIISVFEKIIFSDQYAMKL